MSETRKDLELFSDRPAAPVDAGQDYAVGYGKPPAATRLSLGVEYSANVGTENSLAGAPGHRFGARP
jgi:hypothetical protein